MSSAGTDNEIIIPLKCFLRNEKNCLKCIYNEKNDKCSKFLYAEILDLIYKKDSIVHCEECEHLNEKGICEKFRQRYPFYPENDFFCGFGKKKEGAAGV